MGSIICTIEAGSFYFTIWNKFGIAQMVLSRRTDTKSTYIETVELPDDKVVDFPFMAIELLRNRGYEYADIKININPSSTPNIEDSRPERDSDRSLWDRD